VEPSDRQLEAPPSRGTRERRPPIRFGDYHLYTVTCIGRPYKAQTPPQPVIPVMMESTDVLIVREEGELDSSVEETTHNATNSSEETVIEMPTQESNTRPRPRNRVPSVERRDQQTFKKPHPVTGSSSEYPYVHVSTMAKINTDLVKAKESGTCIHCNKDLPKNKESVRRHVWTIM
jgi:hypothetical protein